MNIGKREQELERLETIRATAWMKHYETFWATAWHGFERRLPENHKRNGLVSVEAVDAFFRCIPNRIKP
jgi:hypothetical protein